ncbi:O-antigen ligase family protein [Mucilaginibacter sp. SJ]|uniref:O-antigen ligase family protein n=1 Tax=Mucilaginibacter sp. SJ TaxID=3029053 RepID=UPI0023A9C3A3|nr:O-antigen ligase family protein [Mucilaginibacter sp. SJ]WEA01622.1 hypothetical protein MusilaSJ_01625 [Mucilaginibacter sp. SJ]
MTRNNSAFVQKVIDYSLVAVFCFFPLSFNLSIGSFHDVSHPLLATNFSVSDLLIGLVLIVWIVKVIAYRQWRNVKYPPKEILLFILFGLLSVMNAVSLSQWVKEFVQLAEYFVLFYLLVINNFLSVNIRTVKYGIFILTTVLVIIAFVQDIILKSDYYLVRGLFINENVLGTYLCMVSPLVYIEILETKKLAVKVWTVAMLVLTSIVLLSGSAICAVLISLLVMSILHSRKTALYYVIVVIVFGVSYRWIMPEKNINRVRDFSSIYEQGQISENYYTRLAMIAASNKTEIFTREFGDKYLKLSTNFDFAERKLNVQKGDLYQEFNNKKAIKNRYLEMQASLILLTEFTPLGVGLGNFQDKIGMYYKGFPKVNTAEPEQHNQFLLIASTSGLLGLTSFLWILMSCFRINLKRYIANKQELFYLGLLGCLIAIFWEGCFSSLLSTALFVPFIFVICSSLTTFNHAKITT